MPIIPVPISSAAARIPGPVGGQFRIPKSLTGVVAVVTGGAAGIGRATAEQLVSRGGVVVIADINADAVAAAAAEVGAKAGRALDVSDSPSFTAFLDGVEAEFGPIGVLVNNAGIMPLGPLLEEDDATTRRIISINLHAMIHGTREAMRRMIPRGSGHIVNLASTAGKVGMPGGATYCATKFAMVGFCESVKGELAGTGVHLTIVLPGVVDTALGEGVKQPIGIRLVQPEDVAAGIVDALQRPRYEVYVPVEAGPLAQMGAALPQAGRDVVAKALGLDRALSHADTAARAEYEAKVRAGSGSPG